MTNSHAQIIYPTDYLCFHHYHSQTINLILITLSIGICMFRHVQSVLWPPPGSELPEEGRRSREEVDPPKACSPRQQALSDQSEQSSSSVLRTLDRDSSHCSMYLCMCGYTTHRWFSDLTCHNCYRDSRRGEYKGRHRGGGVSSGFLRSGEIVVPSTEEYV